MRSTGRAHSANFCAPIVPGNARQLARTSHEYLWDMLGWFGRNSPVNGAANGSNGQAATRERNCRPKELFKRELFGIDEPLGRVVDYFKAAAAGSDVGRRLLLLLGPPSGGKSTMAILLKRGSRGVQPYRRGRDVRLAGLADARIARSI